MPLLLSSTLRARLAALPDGGTLFGAWVCSGSPALAEITAGSGLGWMLIDMEHSPASLQDVQAQLWAASAYDIAAAVRLPSDNPVVIKQVLDLGAQNIVVPMVSSVEQARSIAAAAQYPPAGMRGVGAAFARSARWNRVPDYLTTAAEHVSVIVQLESRAGVEAAGQIAGVEGIDGVFMGPADLAADLGLIGQQGAPEVVAAVESAIAAAVGAGAFAGVNAFDPQAARRYARAGASFVLVGADVTLVAQGIARLAAEFSGA